MKKAVKTTTGKAAAAKAAKAVEAVAETVKEAAVETTEVVKTTVKKTASKKTALKETVYLQYMGKEIKKDDLMKQVKEIWTKELKNKVGDMKTVTLYLKPEENKAYYVINEEVTGSVEM